jgi:cytochrome c peroxidase
MSRLHSVSGYDPAARAVSHVLRTMGVEVGRAAVALVSFLLLTACGGRETGDTPVAPPASPPGEVSAGRFPGIAASLTIDPSALEKYASPSMPAHMSELGLTDNMPVDNPITDAGATLGRVLFFDRQLSLNGNASCASCHFGAAGFGDTVQFSSGFAGVLNTRAQSMRLLNLRYFKLGSAFWDRRASSIEELATQPIRDSIELGFIDAVGGVDSLYKRMRSLRYYPELFAIAFGDSVISDDRVRRALAQYLRSLISRDSKFDRAAQLLPVTGPGGVPNFRPAFASFSAAENRGKEIFMTPAVDGGGGCFGCHNPPSFSIVAGARGNGLDAGETRLFRAPSLKSVATSRHFMHDGRFTTLEQVVEFYNSGVQESPLLDDRMRDRTTLTPLRLRLSVEDKAALVAFLKTLTDETAPTERRFSDPFRR